jgi:hypothetical protein
MAHGNLCPCPNCRRSGGWGWLLLAAVCAAVAIGCYFAARAAVAWLAAHLLIDGLAVWLLGLAGFGLAHKARQRARAGLPNAGRPVSQVPPKPAGATGRLSVPHPRDGGRR